jgi:hypothetical protein
MHLHLRPILKGALTFIPGMRRLLPEGGGQTYSSRYCYGVWLKHFVMAWENGLRPIPHTLAELGPGCSLGTGLAAMLSGVQRYYALDVVRHANTALNLRIFDELVTLFKRRAGRPRKGWPDFDPYLDQRYFPSHILSEEVLNQNLAPERLRLIREAIIHPGVSHDGIVIKYMVPWSDENVIERESVDFIVSHAVLTEVGDLKGTHRALYSWLKPGAMVSHQIGFGFHGYTGQWNGYWSCPDPIWKVITGKRPFILNRLPCSVHLQHLRNQSFEIVCSLRLYQEGIDRSELAQRWRNMSDEDLNCLGVFVQSTKSGRDVAGAADLASAQTNEPPFIGGRLGENLLH